MKIHVDLTVIEIKAAIHSEQITLAGNLSLKIYGTLHCKSGKKLKKQNRVFFKSEAEALSLGFRPCGHCLSEKYLAWRSDQ